MAYPEKLAQNVVEMLEERTFRVLKVNSHVVHGNESVGGLDITLNNGDKIVYHYEPTITGSLFKIEFEEPSNNAFGPDSRWKEKEGYWRNGEVWEEEKEIIEAYFKFKLIQED
jgi:hypothetical protein